VRPRVAHLSTSQGHHWLSNTVDKYSVFETKHFFILLCRLKFRKEVRKVVICH
jgi:hypothetical protein